MAYKFERTGSETKITPTHTESGLPKVECCVNQVEADQCFVAVAIDGEITVTATVFRGKSFADRVAKYMVKGVLSRIGKHRRLTANRAARKASTEESKEVA